MLIMRGLAQSLILRAFVLVAVIAAAATANFLTEVDVTWGDGRGKILPNGDLLQLTMDKGSGSGFQSKQEYLFGRLDMQIKLIPGNSAGTVTTFYLSSQGAAHDEIDFEFLGNSSGEPYVLHTNVFSQGKGNREKQFYLWFDPTADFHTYTILWNPNNIIFYVDGSPIRVFKNNEASLGVPYLKSQPMRIYASLWDGEDWATMGGLVKTDWSQAPFVASYRGFVANACVAAGSCSTSSPWWTQGLDAAGAQKLDWVQNNYMIYDYCRDLQRFPQGLPPECSN